ncbi:MAG TPA: hypothetical protein VMB79_09060 [Jatrophihabitans sp.]|nr:hypothetical protein [Jatrophihabitans sp.]
MRRGVPRPGPNGVFPRGHGRYLVTEINGDWVDEISLYGTVYWSAHPSDVKCPSDTNLIGPDRYLTVDYSAAGQVVILDRGGRPIWRWGGTAANHLDHPSLALPLPSGDVAVTDDFHHRVVVIDPHTDRIVWQHGVTGRPGVAAGC